jgi:hypothetical protein
MTVTLGCPMIKTRHKSLGAYELAESLGLGPRVRIINIIKDHTGEIHIEYLRESETL